MATHPSSFAWRIPWTEELGGLQSIGSTELNTTEVIWHAWTVAHKAPLSMRFSRQEHWNVLAFPSLRDLSEPGIKPGSPAWQVDSLPLSHQGRPSKALQLNNKKKQPN